MNRNSVLLIGVLRRKFMMPLLWLTLVLAVSCGGNKPLVKMDPRFSVNLAPVPAAWPRDDKDWSKDDATRNAQEAAYAKHGRPDYMRLVYTFDDRIIRADELSEHHVMAGKRPAELVQWIYMDKDLAITFNGPACTEGEIPDQVRIVALHGDPNDIKRFPVDNIDRTSFYYWNHGKEFVFVNGKLTEQRKVGEAIPGAVKIR